MRNNCKQMLLANICNVSAIFKTFYGKKLFTIYVRKVSGLLAIINFYFLNCVSTDLSLLLDLCVQHFYIPYLETLFHLLHQSQSQLILIQPIKYRASFYSSMASIGPFNLSFYCTLFSSTRTVY